MYSTAHQQCAKRHRLLCWPLPPLQSYRLPVLALLLLVTCAIARVSFVQN
nr:MAG TPA: hypothetical protein [Caudoviricetes sp.]